MSLHGALRRFACDQRTERYDQSSGWATITRDEKIKWLWADAICIDQFNDVEKGFQLRLMEIIYQQAACTPVWLGPETADSRATVALVHELDLARKNYHDAHETRHFAEMGFWERFGRYDPPLLVYPWQCRHVRFIMAGWFTRVWVIQELAVSHFPLLMFDRHAVTWDSLYEAFMFVSTFGIPMYDFRGVYRVSELGEFRNSYREGKRLPLTHLLSLVRDFHCTEERDRLFALLGLSSDAASMPLLSRSGSLNEPGHSEQPCTLGIESDTTTTPEEAFCDLAIRMLESYERYDILCIPQSCDEGVGVPSIAVPTGASPAAASDSLSLPSWVPNWTFKIAPLAFDAALGRGERPDLAAAPPTKFSADDLSNDKKRIRLLGYPIGAIQVRSATHLDVLPQQGFWRTMYLRVVQQNFVIAQWKRIVCTESGGSYHLTGEPLEDVYTGKP